MRLSTVGSWLRHLLAGVALVFVVAGWLIVTGAATAFRRPVVGLTFSLRNSQFWLHLGAALFVASMFAVWLVVAIVYPFPLLLVLASIPVFPCLMILVVRGSDQSDPSPQLTPPVPTETTHTQISWLSSPDHLRPDLEFRFTTEDFEPRLPIDSSQSATPAQGFPPEHMTIPTGLDPVCDRSHDA
jgi:hypothetical protein